MDKFRSYLLVGVCGFILGAGIIGGFCLYRAGNDAATSRAVITAYQSAVADWQRRAAELTAELGDIRADARQGAELTGQLNAVVAEHFSDIAKARNENERASAQLRLAIAVYDILRRIYDPDYHPTSEANAASKP